jgi:cytochrome c6
MKNVGVGAIATVVFLCFTAAACGQSSPSDSAAEGLFKRHCQPCHPGGKNAINPAKTLYAQDLKKSSIDYAQDLKKSSIETPEAIVKIIRKASPPMPSFDEKTISDEDAGAIARYILQTFK